MAAGLVLLGAFVLVERRSRRPLVPLETFRARSLTAANVVVFFLGAAVFAMWYFASLYMQQVLGYSPLECGIAFLPMTFAIAISSTVAGQLSGRLGPGRVLTAGMALVTLGMLGFSLVSADGSYVADLLWPGVITATGLGFSFVPVTIAAVSGVERARAGLASGLVNTSRQFGGALGLAVLATIASRHTAVLGTHGDRPGAALTGGFHVAFLVGAAFAAAGGLTALAGLARARRPVPQPA
jgi:predicted MFS family arabinose efflux permease